MKSSLIRAGLLAGVAMFGANAAAADVEIEYWQYIYETRVNAMDQLIEKFEEQNPGITVKQVTFPYADYQTRVIAANMAGKGPDVLQLFYGWTDNFVNGGVLQPLPKDAFPDEMIETEFFPIVGAMKRGDDYYGLPTAVRSLALFYNKALFEKAGIENPPATLDELVETAKALTETDAGGNYTTVGMTVEMGGQDHQWWREVLVRQFGGAPYSDDYSEVTYDDAAGIAATKWYTELTTEHKVGATGFMDEGQAAFRAGRAGMTIDGTFRLGSFSTIEDFEWGVAELPANADGLRSNYASYFANGLGAGAEGEELEAAEKFLTYLTSPEAMQLWLEVVGELPARPEAALTEANLADPVYGPFLAGLEYAHTTTFFDEQAQRQVTMDMANRVFLQGQSVEDSVAEAAADEQAILDRFQ
ncbi:extracellular solute-binding protein [Oceanicola sp. S124]|uniref:extracellular solute-binding protein n=1 Tax=Oceanicola sp. S124 TaxID=1042378 RepID=UPI000255A98D|nr:extracellular solute-binding protein [Oceanicola sp. S124]